MTAASAVSCAEVSVKIGVPSSVREIEEILPAEAIFSRASILADMSAALSDMVKLEVVDPALY